MNFNPDRPLSQIEMIKICLFLITRCVNLRFPPFTVSVALLLKFDKGRAWIFLGLFCFKKVKQNVLTLKRSLFI